ncbi:MAG: SIS domain-containing protein [Hydrogenophaga sp.]|uniref:SIS domain-containing protein n=1 Tax=Hydrogenophaga sp. TaxID=1904254 RepID=UPI001E1251BA|nr:SIS domain-containing protein [Hydrogenophaga sp.]MBX3608817.1 SIS domain-containing protein [Hydrogenophaga sp.]
MLLQRIQQLFIDSADLKYQSAPQLAPQVEAAVSALLAGLTGGGKVLTCGNGAGAALAQQFAAHILGRHERDRPGLAAFSLAANAAVITGIASDFDGRQVYARQVHALGLAGDVLLVVGGDGQAGNLVAAVEAAHERDMTVIALTGAKGGQLAGLLRDTDVLVCVPNDQPSRVLEVHLLILHCLADGLDAQLLGLPDTPSNETENPA